MPHRNRTLMIVVALIWIIALAATLVSAAVRSGGAGEPGEEAEGGHAHDGGGEASTENGATHDEDGGGAVSGEAEQSGGDSHASYEH